MDVKRVQLERPAMRAEWLAARAPFVGASQAAALFHEHPFLSLGDLAAEKLERVEMPETPAMVRGRILEEPIARWWSEEHELEIREPAVLYVVIPAGEELGVLCATLDREIVGQRAALEVKTSNHYVHGVERYWYWQAQAQLLCADLERIDFAVLDASMELQSFVVTPELEAQEQLLKRAQEFLEAIRRGETPQGALMTRQTLQRLYPDPEISKTELVAYVGEDGAVHDPAALVRALKVARQRKRALDSDITRLEEIVINQLRGATDGTVNGEVVVSWRPVHRSDIDTQRLRAEHPNLAAEYTRTSTYRRVTIK